MSRNLCTSSCCENVVRLEDIRGRPIEFRRYGRYAPTIGTRWDCPTCGTAYFVIWRHSDTFWGKEGIRKGYHKADIIDYAAEYGRGSDPRPNEYKGRFFIESNFQGETHVEETGTFTLDLSYYESYNDEHSYSKDVTSKPAHLCEDNAEDVQVEW